MSETIAIGASFAILAFLLGLKHSYDADHIVAVANLLRKSQSIKQSLWMSISWSIGHMVTASGITAILYIFRESILQTILSSFELIVGGMLILLGFWSLADTFIFHSHQHGLPHKKHKHTKAYDGKRFHKGMFGIGIVHGLASNDELLILLTAALGVTTLFGMIIGVGIFSVGVVIGMMVFSIIFTLPLIKIYSDKIYAAISFLVGMASILYGGMMFLGIN